jgi:hypothetical protein
VNPVATTQLYCQLLNTLNMASPRPSRAAAWTLSLPTSSQPAESALLPDDGSKGTESIIGDDLRQLVDPRDFYEGGKYRCTFSLKRRD